MVDLSYYDLGVTKADVYELMNCIDEYNRGV